MQIRTMSLGALLCATLTGCPGAELREELRGKDVQIEALQSQLRTSQEQIRSAQEQARSAQAQLEASRLSHSQTSERRRYEQGLMRGLATQLRRVLKHIDGGFTPQPGDLGGTSDALPVETMPPLPAPCRRGT